MVEVAHFSFYITTELKYVGSEKAFKSGIKIVNANILKVFPL